MKHLFLADRVSQGWRPALSPALLVVVLAVAVAGAAPRAAAQASDTACCIAPENGGGTATLPPSGAAPGCAFVGTTEIVAGLPAGTTIQVSGWFGNFTGQVETAGGGLGGTMSTWQGQFLMNMTGTGTLLGFNRSIVIPLGPGNAQMDFSPRMAFAPVQNVNAQVYYLFGQVFGDPDFDLLRISAGYGFGLPAPGQVQVASSGGGWGVSGYFDLTHRIDFVGKAGGALSGLSGSTTRERRFEMCPGGAVPEESRTWSGVKALYR